MAIELRQWQLTVRVSFDVALLILLCLDYRSELNYILMHLILVTS